jgi:hypothetical protein
MVFWMMILIPLEMALMFLLNRFNSTVRLLLTGDFSLAIVAPEIELLVYIQEYIEISKK